MTSGGSLRRCPWVTEAVQPWAHSQCGVPVMQDKPLPHPMRAIQTEEKAMKELSVKYGAGNVRLAKGEDPAQR